MKKIIIIMLFAGLVAAPARSQQEDSGGGAYAPQAGNHQVSLLLGKGMFYSNVSYMLIRKNTSYLSDFDVPGTLTMSDPNENAIGNMIGVEYKYFLTDQIALSFSGAGFVNNTPWREAVDAVQAPGLDGVTLETVLPAYQTIDAQLRTRAVGNLGGQYYFKVKNDRIHPYAGAQFTLQYAAISAQSTYSGEANVAEDARDKGVRRGETYGLAPAITAGIEYSILPGLNVGFEIKAFQYYYSAVKLFAQPGLSAMTAENRDLSFLAQPIFKIGLRF